MIITTVLLIIITLLGCGVAVLGVIVHKRGKLVGVLTRIMEILHKTIVRINGPELRVQRCINIRHILLGTLKDLKVNLRTKQTVKSIDEAMLLIEEVLKKSYIESTKRVPGVVNPELGLPDIQKMVDEHGV